MRRIFYSIVVIFSSLSTLYAQNIQVENLQKHIQTLSSDEYLGRGVGEKGEQLAADYIAANFKNMGLQAWGDSGTYFQHFSFKFSKNPHSDAEAVQTHGKNVVGYLDNKAATTIIIGAHYDHLGTGLLGSSRDPNPEGKIHNGADDNASGTAGVIELARYFSQNGAIENCNFIFIAFSAEEEGLVGSKKFTEYVKFVPTNTHCMINMDMIGRLSDSSHKLLVYGIGTSPVWGNLVQKHKPIGIELVIDSSGSGPTDHTSFYLKDIPVLSFFTGQHKQYHTPEDDAHLINYAGEATILNYIANICAEVAQQPKPAFTKTTSKDTGTRVSFKVTMGVMPDYTFEGPGMRVDGVTEGKPAHKAGIVAGDIILALGANEIAGMKEYMKALGTFSKGQATTAKIKRGDAVIEVQVQF